MWLVRSGSISGFEELVRELGQSPSALLQRAGLNTEQLRNPNTYISYTKMAELLEDAAKACRDDYFGFRLASRQSIMVLGEISVVAAQMPTVADSIAYLTRYLHLHATGLHVAVDIEGDFARAKMSFRFTNSQEHKHLFQLSLGVAYNAVAFANINKPVPTILVRQNAPISRTSKKHLAMPELYQNRVKFSAPTNAVDIPIECLIDKPQYDESIFVEYFEHRVNLLNNLYPDSVKSQTQFIVANLLANSACTLDRVADSLNMHPRVLQKRLKKENASFRQILLDARKTLATENLRHSDIRISELALSLGYSELSVFSRNFKQWTGLSPREWRKQYNSVGIDSE